MTNSDIETLKKSVPMWEIAQILLQGMRKRGQEVDFLCPYHEDTIPSFQVYRGDDGVYLGHCKSCGKSVNVFQLVQQVKNVPFSEAVKLVQKMTTNSNWDAKKAAADSVFQKTLVPKPELISFPLEAFDVYTTNLDKTAIGQEWLSFRGITMETTRLFSIGFVQRPLQQIVPANHPWVDKGWLLFPEIRNQRIVAVKYRSIVGKRQDQWHGFAYKPGMLKSPLYNLEAINSFEDLFIVEGELDCLSLAQAGFVAASIPSAAANPSADDRTAIMRSNARYLAGDMDDAGISAMTKLYKELGGEDPRAKTYYLQWPKPYKDANQFFLEGCGQDIPKFKSEIFRLMEEARARKLPGIQDLKTVTRNANFKPTHDNPARLFWPWPNINKWTDILPGEVMFLFGTETKTGKSTLLMNVLVANVLKGKKVINFSAELSPERYAQIVTAHLLRRNRNTLSEKDFKEAAELLPDDSFYIGYKSGLDFDAVMKLLEDAVQVYGGDILVVDPLHFLIRGARDENAAFASAMRKLVDFSIKWQKIVIVVGQARKSVAGTKGKMAVGQDARFSAALSEDAATTWIIHRNRVATKVSDSEEGEPVFEAVTKIKLDYSRNSDPMSTRLVFDGATASFNSYFSQVPFKDEQNESNGKRVQQTFAQY